MTTRQKAIQIFTAAVNAVQPSQLIPAHLFVEGETLSIFDRSFLINELPNIYVIGAGKASAAMAKTTEKILSHLITAGIVVAKYEHSLSLKKIICLEAGHPIPDENGVAATAKTIELLQKVGENDIVICLISGGASALWIDIPPAASLADVQQTFQLLLSCGATIDEMNTIRKHLSYIKGGQLVQWASKANWFSFIISDVPGDDLSVIASGPTVADNTSFKDANTILEKYNLHNRLPASVRQHINDGINGLVKDTPKAGDVALKNSYNRIIGSNSLALDAAQAKAIELGYHVASVNKKLGGDASTVGRELIHQLINYSGIRPACFLFGGETTVTVTGKGKGGRNQQMALSALLEWNLNKPSGNEQQITFLSAGTDGTDGPTDAAGAIMDRETLTIAGEKKLNAVKYSDNNDAYHFFEQTASLIKTGPTQTNVMDIVVAIIDKDNFLMDD
jgi:glycerate 2-kinase